jgi:hypothetical protein
MSMAVVDLMVEVFNQGLQTVNVGIKKIFSANFHKFLKTIENVLKVEKWLLNMQMF